MQPRATSQRLDAYRPTFCSGNTCWITRVNYGQSCRLGQPNFTAVQYLLLEETIATTMEVVVEELWKTTVTSIPITSAAKGFTNRLFDENTSPAAFPPNRRKAELRKVSEHIKRYMKPVRLTIFTVPTVTRFSLPPRDSSENNKEMAPYYNKRQGNTFNRNLLTLSWQ